MVQAVGTVSVAGCTSTSGVAGRLLHCHSMVQSGWGNKLISECFKVSTVVQLGAIDLWGNAVRGRSKGGHLSQ
jgi:hypothetical protein